MIKPKSDKRLLVELLLGLAIGSIIGYYMLSIDLTKEEKNDIVTLGLLLP